MANGKNFRKAKGRGCEGEKFLVKVLLMRLAWIVNKMSLGL